MLLWVRKTLCLCLPPCHQPLEISCLSIWRKIWSKLVWVLGFYDISVLHGNPCVLINDCIGNFGQIVMIIYWLVISCHIFLEVVGYKFWCVLHSIVYIPQPFLVSCITWWLSLMHWLCFHPRWCNANCFVKNFVPNTYERPSKPILDGWGFWVFPLFRSCIL